MPFTCDVCGNEVSYSEKVFKLRNGAEIVVCSKHLESKKICGDERPTRKTLCQLPKGHEGSHSAVIFWEDD